MQALWQAVAGCSDDTLTALRVGIDVIFLGFPSESVGIKSERPFLLYQAFPRQGKPGHEW